MLEQIQDFVSEKTSAFSDQVQKYRKEYVENVREAVAGSADNVKALKSPVRTFARSGIKLTTVSQTAVVSFIELQSDMVTSALNDVAVRLERASRAENLVELVRDQYEMLEASRERMAEDAQRAVKIFKTAGRDLAGVASHLYERVVEPVEEKIPEVKIVRRKPARKAKKKAVRKARAAKTAAAAA
jgi:hypothetical protein